MERAEADAGAAERVEEPHQVRTVTGGADDEEGVFGFGRKEGAGRLDSGVAGLNDLLRAGQVTADEDVDVGPILYLPELHETPPLSG